MTTRFQEEIQKGHDRREAIQIAAASSDLSILTSALVFFCSTLGVALISTMDLISSICLMLSRGAVISALVCMFILPSVLVVFEPVIAKTTLHWRTPKPPKGEKAPALPETAPEPEALPAAMQTAEAPEEALKTEKECIL